jgi:hypothetical protein
MQKPVETGWRSSGAPARPAGYRTGDGLRDGGELRILRPGGQARRTLRACRTGVAVLMIGS